MFKKLFILLTSSINFYFLNINAQNVCLQYSPEYSSLNDTIINDISENNYNGVLINGAKISFFDNRKVIDLGNNNGYVDLGENIGNIITLLKNFSIVIKIFIPESTDLSQNGNFIWCFANSNDILKDANGDMHFSAKNTRFAITLNYYPGESGIQSGSQIQKGKWLTIIYIQRNNKGRIFINGKLIVAGDIKINPSELGKTKFNYLGKSCYVSDSYLNNAKIADFRIYDNALSLEQIEELSNIPNYYYGNKILLKYDFNSTSDLSGLFTGSLKNNAKLDSINGFTILKLGENNGFFDFGNGIGQIISNLDSFSISTNLFIPISTNINNNGGFVWTFANSDNMAVTANGNLFFRAGNSRYSISKTHWAGESSVIAGIPLPQGEWINLTYTQYNNVGRIFINGELYAENIVTIKPKELGATAYNFLGKSCYLADDYLKSAEYDNFIIYKGIIKQSEIFSLCENIKLLNKIYDSIFLYRNLNNLNLENTDSIRSNIFLPIALENKILISWHSSNPEIINEKGIVKRPPIGSQPAKVDLEAILSYNNITANKLFHVTVLPELSDEESVIIDYNNLKLTGNIFNLKNQIYLPTKAIEGSIIKWESDSPDYLSNTGKVMKLSPYGSGKKEVTLTANISKGNKKLQKKFKVWIAEEENKKAYLFIYFTGNTTEGEQIRYAVSSNGIDYYPLNNGNPIISSDTISIKKGVRDPHILRSQNGKTFYMVATDMKSAEGWTSNRGIVMLKSNDLINWTHSTVNFPTKWPEKWGKVLRVWAPQTIYDPTVNKYMVYFSLYTGDTTCPYDRIYYCYANNDFTDLEGEPQLLFDRGSATIDADIIFNEVDSLYYMFFKNETLGGISMVTSKTLTAPNNNHGSQWSNPSKPLQQTTQAVEGSGVFRLINSDTWILMYDCYTSSHYQFCISNDLKNFKYVKDDYSLGARHGTTITITEDELNKLLLKWSSNIPIIPEGARNLRIKDNGVDIDLQTKTIKIAVCYGTNLKNFDPMLYASPGTTISPLGPQDFTSGSITYTFSKNNINENYLVFVNVEANPVISGFYADPEILFSEKTNKFYIYPTTDGYPGWSGYTFNVFSSTDLVNWTNEGTILDLSTNQVAWAIGNAWAPSIVEIKLEDGSFMYYFYFSGNAGYMKKIGVAVANDPTGPFVDIGKPLISNLPAGVNGQLIDGDVFVDPVSKKGYFYFGNGFLAVAELNDDMISINESTIKIITPAGGTLNDYAYREAPYVFYRKGIYYFIWSVDDTGSDNYHIAYGTSTSPSGPINIPSNPVILIKDPEKKIFGTGHASVLQIPGKDEWYIVYHRINAKYINKGPGYHREICIDKMEFNEDGTIKKIIPTRKGIDAVNISPVDTTAIKKPYKVFFYDEKNELIIRYVYDLTGRIVNTNLNCLDPGIYIIKDLYKNGHYNIYKKFINNH